MNNVTTDNVLSIIFANAQLDASKIMEELKNVTYPEIEKLLRFYRDDIPKKPRCKYDGDAVWFYTNDEEISNIRNSSCKQCFAERGDILVSFWAPFTYYLGLSGKRLLSKNDANIEMIVNRIRDDSDTQMKDICNHMRYLAIHYMTRGNLLRLPNTVNRYNKRNLNPDRFSCAEDKIDQFLWNCFEGGKLFEYFATEEHVKEWILSERLECMFFAGFFNYKLSEISSGKVQITGEDIEISKDTLQSLVDNADVIAKYRYGDAGFPWATYFDRVDKVIAYRNAVGIKARNLFEWEQ